MEEDESGNPVDNWESIYDQKTGKDIANVIVTAEGYTWGKSSDCSINDTISFIRPRKHIFDGMKMKYSDIEGEYLDSDKNLICLDTSSRFTPRQNLIVKKVPFIDFLQNNDLDIIWTILGEKQIFGSGTFRDGVNLLEFSGVYCHNNDKVSGKIKSNRVGD
jgi:hypothetical protein